MVSIQIVAPEYPLEVHRRLSERIFRVVAETYQCEEAAILVSIVAKPPGVAAQGRAGAVGVSPLKKGQP